MGRWINAGLLFESYWKKKERIRIRKIASFFPLPYRISRQKNIWLQEVIYNKQNIFTDRVLRSQMQWEMVNYSLFTHCVGTAVGVSGAFELLNTIRNNCFSLFLQGLWELLKGNHIILYLQAILNSQKSKVKQLGGRRRRESSWKWFEKNEQNCLWFITEGK